MHSDFGFCTNPSDVICHSLEKQNEFCARVHVHERNDILKIPFLSFNGMLICIFSIDYKNHNLPEQSS